MTFSPRLLQALGYPASTRAGRRILLMIGLALGLVMVLGRWLPPGLSPVVMLLFVAVVIVAWLLLFALAHEILMLTAEQGEKCPAPALDRPDSLAGRHLIAWLLALIAVAGSWSTGPLLAVPVTVLACAWLPAASWTIARTSSLADALHPPSLARSFSRISGYGWLATLPLLMAAVSWLLEALPGGRLPELMHWLSFMLWSVLLLAWFRLLGLSVHAGRRQAVAQAREQSAGFDSEDPALIIDWLARVGADEAQHERFHRRLELEDDKTLLIEHARLYLPALVESFDRPGRALEILAQSQAVEPGFVLATPRQCVNLIDRCLDFEPFDPLLALAVAAERAWPKQPVLHPSLLDVLERLLKRRPADRHARLLLQRLAARRLDEDQAERLRRLYRRWQRVVRSTAGS